MRNYNATLLLLALPLLVGAAPQQRAIELAYGKDPSQRVDLWRPEGRKAPLVIFVHGGGWSEGDKEDELRGAKPRFLLDHGFAFAAVNYRLVPEATVKEQVQDVADAIGLFVREGAKLGIDSGRIYLMGHSSGGHVAALLGTEPAFLQHAGVDVSTLAGVILLDGAALAPDQARLNSWRGPFGSPEAARRLSPIMHTALPNARSFLLLNAQSTDLRQQAERLAAALREAGTPAQTAIISDVDHYSLNAQVGEKRASSTRIILDYITATR